MSSTQSSGFTSSNRLLSNFFYKSGVFYHIFLINTSKKAFRKRKITRQPSQIYSQLNNFVHGIDVVQNKCQKKD